ncbi:MAG: cell surface protein SprA [Bacteroidota bacterium]
MPTSRTPSRLAIPFGLALAGLLALVAQPDPAEARRGAWDRLEARSDTDSVAVPRLGADLAGDTLDADALAALPPDTTDSTARARTYFAQPIAVPFGVSLTERRLPGIRGRLGTYWRRDVTLDSAEFRYRVREVVGDDDVRAPADVTLAELLAARRQAALGATFRELAAQNADRQTRRGGSGGFRIGAEIPGGEDSPFRTIFGKNEVALTVNGTSNVNMGMRYNQNDLQAGTQGDGSTLNPDFGQELNLNVAGTIGDKLTVNVNYDTQSQFEFENQVSLVYEGYEDDIIQRIEAGNVFLQTPATLIRGGQRLFGLRTDLQFGPLALTAVASQQDGQSSDVVIEGGQNVQRFDLAPFEYEDNQHFFLGYAFHNWWDTAHRTPGIVTLHPDFDELIGIEVWKHEPGLISATTENIETTWAIALADLGEPTDVLDGGLEYLGDFNNLLPGQYDNIQARLPDPADDQYSEAELNAVRADGATVDATDERLFSGTGARTLTAGGFANNKFRRLRTGIDYTVDGQRGWLSLTAPLSESEQLAVAYQYRTREGRTVNVGDYLQPSQTDSQTGARTVLKLLRSDRPTPASPLWDLTMRNVYRVGGRSLTAQSFDLDITFEPAGATASTDPRDISFEGNTFMQVLGLDRVNGQGRAPADSRFDFIPGYTIDPANGRVVFPVRQPFGDYLENLIVRNGVTVGGEALDVAPTEAGLDREEAAGRYVPRQPDPDPTDDVPGAGLYDLVQNRAQRELPALTRFQIEGEFKSASQSTFNVGFQLVEGTVRVTSNGIELQEGTDYTVNTTAGTVDIIDPRYLAEGQRIQVSVEQNQLFQIGAKTLLGLRADYRLGEDARLGATWMRLAERPLDEKPAIGREALNNTILGIDGSYTAEPRWLTRAVDALPLLQTRAPSLFELRGEVARLSPGHPNSTAFDRTRDALRDDGLDFDPDELAGISYIDAFENSENAFTGLSRSAGWRIAAAPDSAGPPGTIDGGAESTLTDPTLKSNWRGLFTWYTLTRRAYAEFGERELLTRATQPIRLIDLFPERAESLPDANERNFPVDLLDVYIDPTRRGPYNFNGALETDFAATPEAVWGGFIRPIDGSYADFDGQNNVEFVEILFSPLGGRDGDEPIGPNARLYVDLGRLNEDILPNGGFTNSEDGLRDGEIRNEAEELDTWGRRPTIQTNGVLDLFRETGRTEDLGLDGLPSRANLIDPDADESANYPLTEAEYFAEFVTALTPGTPEFARAADVGNGFADPSGDDYHFFLDFSEGGFFDSPERFPGGASVQERYGHYLPAFELNSIPARRELGLSAGVATLPNSEDINGNSRADVAEQYHRYEIPLTDAGIRASPFFLNTLQTGDETNRQDWYLMRIPVRTEARSSVGFGDNDDDFSRIEAVRVWTQGHDKPATIRFATFELVGSQWLKSDRVGSVSEGRNEDVPVPPELFIASVNNEENGEIYAIPRGTVQKLNRSISGPARPTREESIVFRAEGLEEGRRAGISRTYATNPLDLTKYERIRMEVHGHGFAREDSVRVFLRFGDDETDDYYEIEQPVVPFDPDPDRLEALGLGPGTCPIERPSNCARSDSLWQTNVRVGGERVDLNAINVDLSAFNRAKLARDLAEVDPFTPFTVPGTPEGSPAGTRITVRGQPSIQDVRTIVLGVVNGTNGDITPIDTVEIWFNELRVTGYDEAGGSSGFVTARLGVADIANVDARLVFENDGFGELGGALGSRTFASSVGFSLTSAFQAHKLLPERFGWSIPVSLTVTENTSTPRFDPDQGDIRLNELIETAEAAGDALPEAIRADAVLERAQTTSSSRNVNVRVSKSGSRSPWLRYTLDGLSASYTSSASEASDPRTSLRASDAWSGNLAYRVTAPRPLTVRPLWFTRPVPVLGLLGGLQFNVLPQNVTMSADARRSSSAIQQRLGVDQLTEPEEVRAFRAPVRRTHSFDHGRQLNVTHSPFSFLRLTYASNTDQDFGATGQREFERTLVRDTLGRFSQTFDLAPVDARDDPDIREALFAAGVLDSLTAPLGAVEFLGGPDLEVLPLGEALGGIFGGDGRTRAYTQRLTVAPRITTRRVKWLSWIQPQTISYSGDYRWNDLPIANNPDLEVARVQTSTSFQSGVKVVPRDFWRLFPFYRRIEAAGDAQPQADTTGGGFDPVRFGARLARGAFLAVTGIDDITLRYQGSLTAAAGGLEGQSYSLLSGLRGDAPPLGFRLGLERTLDIDRRIANRDAGQIFNDALGEQHDLDARTTFQPLRGLNVSLNGRTTWGASDQVALRFDPEVGRLARGISTRRGNGESTVFSFGGSYEAFVRRHAERLQRDVAVAIPGEAIDSEFGSPTGLAEDFRAEFARGAGAFGPNGLFQIPLPGWNVSYSGLEKLPLVNRIAQQISLQHGYSSTNRTDYATAIFDSTAVDQVDFGDDTFTLRSEAVRAGAAGFDEPTDLTVSERFQPLIGLNMSWKGGLQTSVTLNQSRTYSLQAITAQVREKTTRDIRFDLSYAKTGLRLLGLRRLNNNLRLTLTGVLSDNIDTNRSLLQSNGDVTALLNGEGLPEATEIVRTSFQLSPRISYTISNQVTADVFVRYERVFTQGTAAGSNRSFDGGVNLRILFSN